MVIEFEFPLANAEAQKVLSQCVLSKPGAPAGAPCPRYLRLTANVNRVEINLNHENSGLEKIDDPFYGALDSFTGTKAEAAVAAKDGKPAKPAVAAKPGRIVLTFSKTKLFQNAAVEYVSSLNGPSK